MKLDAARVGVIILNWRNWPRTLECLASLDSLDYPNFEILVVDNGSENGSQARIEAARPDVKVIQVGANLGYAGGNNVGIRHAIDRGADYVWVLNNDTLVEPGTLAALIEVVSSEGRLGILGAAVMERTGEGAHEVDMSAYRWQGERMAHVFCSGSAENLGHRVHSADGVTGTSLLLDTEMIQQIGSFDERFFHYFEDVELCERARRAGWAVGYACRARVWHSVGSSLSNFSAQARYYYIRNWLLFRRWSGRGGLGSLFRHDPVLAIARVFGVLWLLKGRWRVAMAGTIGAFDAVRQRYGKRDLRRWPFGAERVSSGTDLNNGADKEAETS